MSIIFNGSNINNINYKGTKLNKVIYNNVEVFNNVVKDYSISIGMPSTYGTTDVSKAFNKPINITKLQVSYNQWIADDITMSWNANVRIRNANTKQWVTLDSSTINAPPQKSYNYNKTFTSIPNNYYDMVSVRIYDPNRCSAVTVVINGFY